MHQPIMWQQCKAYNRWHGSRASVLLMITSDMWSRSVTVLVLPDGLARVFQISTDLLMSWCVMLIDTEWCEKRNKTHHEQQFCGWGNTLMMKPLCKAVWDLYFVTWCIIMLEWTIIRWVNCGIEERCLWSATLIRYSVDARVMRRSSMCAKRHISHCSLGFLFYTDRSRTWRGLLSISHRRMTCCVFWAAFLLATVVKECFFFF